MDILSIFVLDEDGNTLIQAPADNKISASVKQKSAAATKSPQHVKRGNEHFYLKKMPDENILIFVCDEEIKPLDSTDVLFDKIEKATDGKQLEALIDKKNKTFPHAASHGKLFSHYYPTQPVPLSKTKLPPRKREAIEKNNHDAATLSLKI